MAVFETTHDDAAKFVQIYDSSFWTHNSPYVQMGRLIALQITLFFQNELALNGNNFAKFSWQQSR
ncbi:MAG: hypothetical protein EB150_02495 [Nitrososphaeria archaeon]|nr:hypothetical protein [Nitrososphaeria archaeon]NDB50817.1 hypothetical protein [Nitrosopumilaceae archaeon]NDB88398.1 hypothetical protein [Nitrososphaerota archaeon]NDB89563.1 hypothetical protein [Nitrososphaerota archaeon]NDF26369.1 hypothetical protein [Nitrosopumilaceae archaeon]